MKSIASILFVFCPLVGAACAACFFESLSYLLVRPMSLANHRRVCTLFSRAFFLASSFLLETWAGLNFKSYGDRLDPSKSYLAVVNHRSNVDWLIGLAYISRFGPPYPGNAKSVVKASLGKVPIFGYLLHFAEFLFLTRNWAADKDKFFTSLRSLRSCVKTGIPLWFVLYPEGTRFTKEKQEYSRNYAQSKNLRPTENVLFPRYKAFTAILATMREELDGVVDATFMFEGQEPNVKTVLDGTASTIVHTHMKYYPMKELPKGDKQLEQWLLDRWYMKDKCIELFHQDRKSLGEPEEQFFHKNCKPSLVPFYALVTFSQISACAIIYAFSKIPNGLFLLFGTSLCAVSLTGIFLALNIRPSRKGSGSSKKVE